MDLFVLNRVRVQALSGSPIPKVLVVYTPPPPPTPLPLLHHSFFFALSPNFLDELARRRLQANPPPPPRPAGELKGTAHY